MKKHLIYYKYGEGGEVFFVQLLGRSEEEVKEEFIFNNPKVKLEEVKELK